VFGTADLLPFIFPTYALVLRELDDEVPIPAQLPLLMFSKLSDKFNLTSPFPTYVLDALNPPNEL
jgi:hypothetical protein